MYAKTKNSHGVLSTDWLAENYQMYKANTASVYTPWLVFITAFIKTLINNR